MNFEIYVDGGMNKQTGNEAWGSVVDSKGNDIIPKYLYLLPDLTIKEVNLPKGKRHVVVAKFNSVHQQNNGAELLAMVIGLRIAKELKSNMTIYSDSDLIVKFWSVTGVSKKNKISDNNKLKYINEIISNRSATSTFCKIMKISGKDNKADLGYHRK